MLYTHATIITVNPSREIILNGAILVQGHLIAAIDKTDVFTKMHPAEEIVDLEGHIIIPGLISTHMHTAQTLLRGELYLNLIDFLLFVTTNHY
jgi:cytosine/adenosine deaminase-related metal-dependent hydrolase